MMEASTSAPSATGRSSLLRPMLKHKPRKVIARPSPEELKEREKGFLLDGTLLSRQANDETDRCNPSYLNIGIPQYNALSDPHLKRFLRSKSFPKVFQKEIKENQTTTMQGALLDRITTGSHTLHYIQERNALVAAGYTRDIYGGHLSLKTDEPKVGYHGPDGYRRNTPNLRRRPSVFDDEELLPPISLKKLPRTMSAPATLKLHRLHSAKIYSNKMSTKPAKQRTQSALPH